MNADDARRESAFMDWYLPKNKQRTVPQVMVNDYCGAMNDERTVITFLGPMAEVVMDRGSTDMDYDLFDSNGEFIRAQKLVERKPECQRWVCDRETLIKLLMPMTSDHVIFEVSTDYPGRIIGQIGDRTAAAVIAPRIGE